MNILIVKLSAIGDVIHTLPALNAVRKQYPDAHITWLVEEATYSVIKGHKALDRIIVSRRKRWLKGLAGRFCVKNFREACGFIKQLRDTNYDIILDFQALLKSGVLIELARGGRKIGFDKGMDHQEHSYIFLNERIKPVDMEVHALTRGMMLLESIGIKSRETVFNVPISEQDRDAANDLLMQHGIKAPKPLVAINPMAKWETKLWDNLKFANLADRLIEQANADVIFTGSREDSKAIEDIISNMKAKASNLAGRTDLKTLAALYEKTSIVVSTDTGPMHLAAAIGTPVVALFGPTAPWRTGPFGPGHKIIRADMECSPCFKRQCKTIDCMKQITVDQVFEAAMSAILLPH
ncbi:MAG: lipopolysaccharide heptosyltransferase I [Desulfobacteraceae bacterium]|uniref:Lipopolysaccharide heptosyltransferase 1 n=1 Tax=Candidatus Desulfaltia bathyphila TaxID=2841697 RepID=A0A8J6N5Z5_9BACT|nr:lipopolysaccharide heptosyltransferase I [Candidatus Desulfaltia bathyphila]